MPKPKDKKKTPRNKAKYPNLQAKFMPRIRAEFIDYDYLDQLSQSDLDYLNKFTGEFHGASFQHDETDIQSYETYGKDCNDRNNSANRDTYGILKIRSKSNKNLVNYDSVIPDIENPMRGGGNPMHMENAYVDFLEAKELQAMIEEYDHAMLDFNEISELLPQLLLD
jgi:hypothetical protein